MENIFSSKNKTGLFNRPTHIVKGQMNGNFTLNKQEHNKFIEEFIKNKTNKSKKNYDTINYLPVSNTWTYYKI